MKYNYQKIGNEHFLEFNYHDKHYLISTHENIIIIKANFYKLI